MLRLQQTFGAHAGRSREIDQEVVRFGRLPTNDFAFDPHADLDASGNHAEIRRESGRFVLVDVGSRNGTLVDGRPVQRCVLEGGEEIEFGTGGPRVRVEIVAGITTGRGAPTAPATPMTPPIDAPVSPQGPTALAPSIPAGAVPTPAWPARPQPPFSPPAIPPSQAPPPMIATPAPIAPGFGASAPSPSPPGGAPKLYGQRTVDMMIQSAVSGQGAAQAQPQDVARPHDTAYIRKVADEAAGQKSRPMVFVLGIVLALFGITLCGVSGIIVVLWMQAYGAR